MSGEIPKRATFDEVLALFGRALSMGLRVSAPGKVAKYDATLQRADIVLEFLTVTDDGTGEQPQQPLVLPKVPVMWPRTNAGYLTFPMMPGDTGLLVFSDRALENWKRQGKTSDPLVGRVHSLSDGVFVPGLHPDTNAITPATDPAATVIDGNTLIKVGRTASEAITKAESLIAAVDAALTAAVTAASPIASPSADGGTAGFTALQNAWDSAKNTIKATKGRVE